jgi:hypothetical protein
MQGAAQGLAYPRIVSMDVDVPACNITRRGGLVGHTAAVCSRQEVGSPQGNLYTRLHLSDERPLVCEPLAVAHGTMDHHRE